MIRLLLAVFVVCALVVVWGCMVQPVDSVTGAKVGPALSTLDDAPEVNPDTGNPVTLDPTNRPDFDRVAVETGKFAQNTAPYLGPYGAIVSGVAALAVPAFLMYRKRRKGRTAAK